MKAVLDVRRLLVLRAVAQHGSIAAAARALGYSQPAVSHHIHRLEAETGVRLVIRDGRGVTLTDAGQALVVRAATIAAELTAAEAQLAAFARTAAACSSPRSATRTVSPAGTVVLVSRADPRHHESDAKVHRGRITKQGSTLVRWAAVRSCP